MNVQWNETFNKLTSGLAFLFLCKTNSTLEVHYLNILSEAKPRSLFTVLFGTAGIPPK